MTTAQSRVADLARWIDASSGPRDTPMGGATEIGRYAVIVPCDFDEPPRTDFDAEALPLFVSMEQAEGVATGPIVTDAPASQDHVRERLAHILWKIGTDLAPMAVVGLDDPQEPISGAVERAGADAVNVGTYPVLAVPLYAFSAADRATIAARLPVLP